jgi:hypothetical protein
VDRDPAHAVVGPDGHHGVVGEAPVGQDAVGLGEQVGPVLRCGVLGIGDRQAVPGGVEGGVEVEPAVGPDVGVGGGIEALVDGEEAPVAVGGGEVGDPDVVAGGRPEVLGQQQPTAVDGDVDRVVGGGVAPVTEHQLVAGRVGAEPVEANPAVEGLFARRHLVGGKPADVVERRAIGRPGQGAVAAPVDGSVHHRAAVDRHHPQRRLLVAGVGQEVGEEGTVGRGEPPVEGDRVVVGQRAGVDEDPPAGEWIVAGGEDGQHGVLLVGMAPHHEVPLAPDGGGCHEPHRQFPQPSGESVPGGDLVEEGADQPVLGLGPRPGGFGVGVFQPAVGIGDGVSVEVVDDVLSRRVGVRHLRREGVRD